MIRTVCNVDAETRQRNHKNAVGRGLPWLTAHPSRDKPLALVGGGESAALFPLDWEGDVLAVNGAYCWLMERGRVADYVFSIDADPKMVGLYPERDPRTQWIVASCSDPALFDLLEGEDVSLCTARQEDEAILQGDVPGGPTALSRAPIVGAIMGYRDMTLYGIDSCFPKGRSHIYGGPFGPQPRLNYKGWDTTLSLLAQAQYLAEMIPAMNAGPLNVKIAGHHLASELLNEETQEAA